MKFLILAVVSFGLLGSAASYANEELMEPMESLERGVTWYTQPCENWRYSTEVRGYICSYHTTRRFKLVEERDLQDAEARIRVLEQKNKELEDRIAKLETPNP